ncbi:hypothetical protein M0813_05798 [Anaeramoeba flamelloides]|uniref:DDE Tnp4 domain-containing protein n=1 Tax=Anaeramoeba flamelloides TaxID=1746091 RepID=A0ABQ8XGD5_9EUKA|nr:hypothetical protein M0813_05798 [Anaeramoeba flamelloides]
MDLRSNKLKINSKKGRPIKYKRNKTLYRKLKHNYSKEWDRGVCYKCTKYLNNRATRKFIKYDRPFINTAFLSGRDKDTCKSVCGLTNMEFKSLYSLIKSDIEKPRQTKKRIFSNSKKEFHPTRLKTDDRLLMTLMWLRLSLPYRVLEFIFKIHNSTVSRDVLHVTLSINQALKKAIKWPNAEEIKEKIVQWGELGWTNIMGTLDITEHIRNRATKFESLLHSGKQKHSTIKSITVVDIDGLFLYFKTGYKGHLNDENVWNIDKLQSKLPKDTFLLADGGFYGPMVTKPLRKNWIKKKEFGDARQYNKLHSQSRAIVECAFSILKSWKISAYANRLTLGRQILVVNTCAKLCNWTKRLYRINKLTPSEESIKIIRKYENYYRMPSSYLIKQKFIKEKILKDNQSRLLKTHYIEFLQKRAVAVGKKTKMPILKKLVQQYWSYTLQGKKKSAIYSKILTKPP